MRRIERLINLIAALLDSPRPMTADEIRSKIAGYDQETHEAFRRAFERDKEAIRAMGIPLEVVRLDPFSEQADGYTIPKERYYLPHIDLEPDELTALRLAADVLVGAGEEAGAGVLKLSVDDPAAPAAGPRFAWGADLAAEEPVLGPLYSALLARRPVAFAYESAEGERSDRALEPYGIVHRGGRWYVVGRDVDRDAIRSFRLSRVVGAVREQPGGYEIPTDFNAADHVSQALEIAAEAPTTVVVRFDRSMRWWAEQNLSGHAMRDAPDGALDVDMTVGNLDALVSWLLGFAEGVEIVGPPAARRAVVEHLAPFLEPSS